MTKHAQPSRNGKGESNNMKTQPRFKVKDRTFDTLKEACDYERELRSKDGSFRAVLSVAPTTKAERAARLAAFADKVYAASEPEYYERDCDDSAIWSLRYEGRNDDGTGESYAERNQ